MAPRSPEISVRQPWARVSAPVHETENHLNSPQRQDSGFSLYFRSEDLTGDIYPFKCRLLPPRPCRHLCEPPRWRRRLAQALRAPGRPPPPTMLWVEGHARHPQMRSSGAVPRAPRAAKVSTQTGLTPNVARLLSFFSRQCLYSLCK